MSDPTRGLQPDPDDHLLQQDVPLPERNDPVVETDDPPLKQDEPLLKVVRENWGYTTLRPLQHEAMKAAHEGRDSLVVLPTGGGKSLCYQAPALLSPRPTVVISPLIALMKDQVDRLLERSIPSAFFNSTLDAADRRRVLAGIREQKYRLLFVAPERLNEGFLAMLQQGGIGAFAIDEAHCISHWGHDFRADYRRLDQLKQRFPDASVNAFTATATPQVRNDIIEQLRLDEPSILVGDFFRPNLHYHVRESGWVSGDVLDCIRRRKGQAGIVYCIRRRDVDGLAAFLIEQGVRAAGYHAGMNDAQRTRTQEAFAAGEIDVVVATVAFGMGIDRADIRFVIHSAMPKSIEHYQQETGRAGRDGLPADCVLFYGGEDYHTWQFIIEQNESDYTEVHMAMLNEMFRFCSSVSCRHRKLVTYFGQKWELESCGACDVCLGDRETLPDSTVVAQKIMSAVYRTGQRYGPAYVCDVLLGKATERVIDRGHDEIKTFGIMEGEPVQALRNWVDQLVDQRMLERSGEFGVLKIMPKGWQVLRSQAEASLFAVKKKRARRKKKPVGAGNPAIKSGRRTRRGGGIQERQVPPGPLDADDLALFEKLREWRRGFAEDLNVPAFMILSDKTLRAVARARPTDKSSLLAIRGIGKQKWEALGERLLEFVSEHGA